MPTWPSSSTARSVAWALVTDLSCARIISPICQPTLYSGCRLVSGSWKITAMSLPRIFCSSRGSRPTRFTPSKTALPVICPPGVSPSSDWVSTVLPDPDSPTIPSVRPRSTVNDTPRTACTTPSAVGKLTRRSVTSSRLMNSSRRGACADDAPGSGRFPYSGGKQAGSSLSRLRQKINCVTPCGPVPAGHVSRARPEPLLSGALEPDVGDVRPADVRREHDGAAARGLAGVLDVHDPLARVIRGVLVHQRDDHGVLHGRHVNLVPERVRLGEARRGLGRVDQAVNLGVAVAAVVDRAGHAVGAEERVDHGAAVVPAEPVGDPSDLRQVEG